MKSATDVFALKTFSTDIFNEEICFKREKLYSYCSLNYTPLGPVTITYKC